MFDLFSIINRITLPGTGEEYFVFGAYIDYFCVANISLCVKLNVNLFCMVIHGNCLNCLVESKYAELGIAINSCSARPEYSQRQNHVNNASSTQASLLFCEAPPTSTTVSDDKNDIAL